MGMTEKRKVNKSTSTFIVAAADSLHPGRADYVCGGTDDQVVINAAIAEATLGGKIQLLEGRYYTGAPIIMNNSVWLAGSHISVMDPIGTSILLQANSNCDILQVDGNGTHLYFPHISDMFIDGDKSHQTSGNGIHFVADLSDAIVENVFVHRCKEAGICEDTGWYMRYMHVWSEFNIGPGWDVVDAYLTSCVSAENDGTGILSTGGKLHIVNSRIKKNKLHGIHITDWTPLETTIVGNSIAYNSNTNVGTYDGIHITGGHATHFRSMLITGNVIGSVDASNQRNAIRITDGNGIMVNNNVLYPETANPTVVYSAIGTENQIRNNIGYVTENSGTDTVALGATTKAVTHGLAVTPAAGDIAIVPTGAWGAVTQFYISAYSATTFTVTVDQVPGGAGFPFAWKAIVL